MTKKEIVIFIVVLVLVVFGFAKLLASATRWQAESNKKEDKWLKDCLESTNQNLDWCLKQKHEMTF